MFIEGTFREVHGLLVGPLSGRLFSVEKFLLLMTCISVEVVRLKDGKDTFTAGIDVMVKEGCICPLILICGVNVVADPVA